MLGMFLSVGAGGALGAMARFALGLFMADRFGTANWLATLAANLSGCFLMGMLAAYLSTSAQISEPLRGFISVGFLGGLTTFSTFSLDGYGFWVRGDLLGGAVYIGLSVGLSLLGFAAGFWILRSILGTG